MVSTAPSTGLLNAPLPMISRCLPLLFVLLVKAAAKDAEKNVVVRVNSKWDDTSLLLEASEYIAYEGPWLFWQFLDKLAEPDVTDALSKGTERDEYDLTVKYSALLISNARMDLMKFSLAMRVHSPAVEMFRQMAEQVSPGSCDAFADVHGKITCDPDDLDKLLNEATGEVTVYSVDHVFPGTRQTEKKVVLYAKLGTKSFAKFHTALRRRAQLADDPIGYVMRHYEPKVENNRKVRLSGFGVELAIKSTEYKAQDDSKVKANASGDAVVEEEEGDSDLQGFNFNLLKKLHPDLKTSLQEFKTSLLDADELTPLKIWQLQDLSFQAGQRVAAAKEPKESFQLLKDISQNFPIFARSLTKTIVKREFREEVENNQENTFEDVNVAPGDSALLVNGLLVDLDVMDIFALLDLLKREEKLANGFFQMGYRKEYLTMLTAVDLSTDKTSYAIDYRPGRPDFINNMDIDKRYRDWGNSVKMMVQPYFPGMMRPIARNFFTLVFILDPGAEESFNLFKIAYSFFAHEIPVRIGFIWIVPTDKAVSGMENLSVAMLNYYNFVKSDKSSDAALRALTDMVDKAFEQNKNLTVEDVHFYCRRKYPGEDWEMIFAKDSDYDQGRQTGSEYLTSSGLGKVPVVLLNGVPLDETGLSSDRFEETVITEVMRQTRKIQVEIMQGRLDDSKNVADYLMGLPEVIPRLNSRILNIEATPANPISYVDMTDVMEYYPKSIYEFRKLNDRQRTAYMVKNIPYIKKTDDVEMRPVTIWLAIDLDARQGRQLLYNALKHMKHTNKVRLGVIHNPTRDSPASQLVITKLVEVALKTQQMHVKKAFVAKILKQDIYDGLKSGTLTVDKLDIHAMDIQAFKREFSAASDDFLKIHSIYAQQTLELKPGQAAVICNGRVIGPLPDSEGFIQEDFNLLEKFTLSSHSEAIAKQIETWEIEHTEDKASDVVMRTASLIMANPVRKRRAWIYFQGEKHSVVSLPASDETTATIDVVAIVDPLSREAQKLAALLSVLVNVVNADIKVAMNCKPKLSEMPLKSFYRLVLEAETTFTPEGDRRAGPVAKFSELPTRQLLTLNVISPDSWLITSKRAAYDLDNIKMDAVDSSIDAEYELQYILLEGHCFDEVTGSPPRGLQLTIGTKDNPDIFDTIVMANLGYFQLKAAPGLWQVTLRDGRSSNIYHLTTTENTESAPNAPKVEVAINAFTGRTIRVKVKKFPDKLDQHLLLEAKDLEEKTLWQSLSEKVLPGTKEDWGDTINIFSLASGHLYERFMRIMMLSVLKNTKTPVKFWFLKNYLSPDFKDFLPYMAEHYGFEYSLVEYKWPRWLHQQTEKQRIIWGYKILFLDVLFPLDVKKIIYVDADQVVRTDMADLMEFSLEGAPYGYTPFCDSRTEMEGFRFWKQGYWNNHLAGRKYHISALYVVDLKKFRQIAAGDRLRGQYQGLSADPNSLSNLDQDLPNNMIHQVKIKSLPQEWLWCETWCDDKSKPKAKTIDLCNNPMTKEPKLDSAVRIIPEWKSYDGEIKELRDRFDQKLPPGHPEKKKDKEREKHVHDET